MSIPHKEKTIDRKAITILNEILNIFEAENLEPETAYRTATILKIFCEEELRSRLGFNDEADQAIENIEDETVEFTGAVLDELQIAGRTMRTVS